MRIRERVIDRRRHERPDLGGNPPGDLGRDHGIGEERSLGPVLLGRAGRDDDGVVVAEERLDLRAGHLAEKHGWWLHRLVLLARQPLTVVVNSPIPSIQQVTTSPGLRWRSGPGGVPRRTGVPVAIRSPVSSRTWRLMKDTISGIENRMSAVVPSWTGSPLIVQPRR